MSWSQATLQKALIWPPSNFVCPAGACQFAGTLLGHVTGMEPGRIFAMGPSTARDQYAIVTAVGYRCRSGLLLAQHFALTLPYQYPAQPESQTLLDSSCLTTSSTRDPQTSLYQQQ